jgi:hypothetical protein
MSMKNFNDTIGNLTRDLLPCITVSQPTAPLRIPRIYSIYIYIYIVLPPYPWVIRSMTYRGYVKPQIIPNAIYNVIFV